MISMCAHAPRSLRLLAAMAALLAVVATSGRASECPPTEIEFDHPGGETAMGIVYSDAAETIHLSPDQVSMGFDAKDGDDVIYMDHVIDGAQVMTGRGADTLVICGLGSLFHNIYLVSAADFSADMAVDEIILEPAVFRNVPDPFVAQLIVYGFVRGDDRIKLRLPPGVQAEPASNDMNATLRAGNVYINVLTTDSRPLPLSAFEIEHVDEPDDVRVLRVSEPVEGSTDVDRCSRAPSNWEDAIAGRNSNVTVYTHEDNVVRIEREGDNFFHILGRGNDRAFMFATQTVNAGAGNDWIIICALDDLETNISLGASMLDTDADTVVVEAGRLQDGPGPKELTVTGVSPIDDRVILRVSEGMTIEYPDASRGSAVIGNLTVNLDFGDWRPEMRSGHDVFIVERAEAVEAAVTEEPTRPDMSRLKECGTLTEMAEFAQPRIEPVDGYSHHYSENDDDILVDAKLVNTTRIYAGRGRDFIYVDQPPSSVSVEAGHGADVIIVCDMDELALSLAVQPSTLDQPDQFVDRVVLGPDVFVGVPEGTKRHIRITGLAIGMDELVLRLPPGMRYDVRPSATGETSDVHVGDDVIIRVAPSWAPELFPFQADDLTIEEAAPTKPLSAAPAPGPNLEAQAMRCPDDTADGEGGAFDEFTYGQRVYTADADKILAGVDPDILDYKLMDGDDRVVVRDVGAVSDVYLGRGADVAIVCSLEEVSLSFVLGNVTAVAFGHDLDPDTVIFEAPALFDVPEGFTREIRVGDVMQLNDRVVFRVPEGYRPEIRRHASGHLEIVFPDTVVSVSGSADYWGDPVSTDAIVFKAAAGNAGAPTASGGGEIVQAPDASDASANDEAPSERSPVLEVPDQRWRFDASIGLEGRASVTGARGLELQVECGNGGAPALWFDPDPRYDRGSGSEPVLDMVVDGERFPEPFECGDDGSYCTSGRVPAIELIDAMRRGSRLVVEEEGQSLTAFGLKGSHAAIGRLAACLSYPPSSTGENRQSFDCSKAGTNTEKAICGSSTLSELDLRLSQAFKNARSRASQAADGRILRDQKSFLNERDQCGSSDECIGNEIRYRIDQLKQEGTSQPITVGEFPGVYCNRDGTEYLAVSKDGSDIRIQAGSVGVTGDSCSTGAMTATAKYDGLVAKESDCTLTVFSRGGSVVASAAPPHVCHDLFCGFRANLNELEFNPTARRPLTKALEDVNISNACE
ncbi:hypothetical protein A3731_14310 [Roseovarius sp. HI0049]|nr:hypothetical protein A3731_14310 [Roseovarius sp. HI0049]